MYSLNLKVICIVLNTFQCIRPKVWPGANRRGDESTMPCMPHDGYQWSWYHNDTSQHTDDHASVFFSYLGFKFHIDKCVNLIHSRLVETITTYTLLTLGLLPFWFYWGSTYLCLYTFARSFQYAAASSAEPKLSSSSSILTVMDWSVLYRLATNQHSMMNDGDNQQCYPYATVLQTRTIPRLPQSVTDLPRLVHSQIPRHYTNMSKSLRLDKTTRLKRRQLFCE